MDLMGLIDLIVDEHNKQYSNLSFFLAGHVPDPPHIQLVQQPLHQSLSHSLHLNIRPPILRVLNRPGRVLPDQHEDNPDLFVGAERHVHQEVFSLFGLLALDYFLLGFLLLLFFLEVVFGLGLGHFHGDFFGGLVFFGSSAFIGGVLYFDAGDVVSDHFSSHFLQFFSLFVDPLLLSICYIVGSVVHLAVVPHQLNIRQTLLHHFIPIVA